jgi:hypothetical protein
MPNVEVMTRKDVRDLSVIAGGLEVLDWVLYDTLVVPVPTASNSYRFFQQAIGTNGISLESTNMEIPGQLPAGYKFVCQKLIMVPKQALTLTIADLRDINALVSRGRAQFFIGTRPYLQVPVADLIGGQLQGFAATAAGAASFEVAYAAPRTVINGELEYSPVLPANYSFSVLVEYDTAPVVVKATPLQVQMVGKLIRPRQG